MKYLYFPGCSLKSTGKPYEESILSVFRVLDVEIEELKDWNCCGATAYMAVDEMKSFSLCARNFALAVEQCAPGKNEPAQIITPCSACFSLLLKSQHYMDENPEVGRVVNAALKEVGYESEGLTKKVRIRHPLDVLVNDIGVERIKEKVKRPLKGLRVIPYYGCLLVRPYATFDHPYNPTSMDRLIQALGAEPVDWALKTRCCGGTLSGMMQGVGLRLSYLILKEASRKGGELLLTAPLGSGIHQSPFHFYGGFTPFWYEKFLTDNGFTSIRVSPNGNCARFFGQEALRQLLFIGSHLLKPRRCLLLPILFVCFLLLLAPALLYPLFALVLDRLDEDKSFTVGYFISAKRR